MSIMSHSRNSNHFALYLPRVELHHVDRRPTEHSDYITRAFYNAGYGVVSKIFPLLKTDAKTGLGYYSAIVYFERWFSSQNVYNFLLNLEQTKLGNKFIHCPRTGKYWFVQKHTLDKTSKVESEEQREAKKIAQETARQDDAARRLQWVREMRARDESEQTELSPGVAPAVAPVEGRAGVHSKWVTPPVSAAIAPPIEGRAGVHSKWVTSPVSAAIAVSPAVLTLVNPNTLLPNKQAPFHFETRGLFRDPDEYDDDDGETPTHIPPPFGYYDDDEQHVPYVDIIPAPLSPFGYYDIEDTHVDM